MDSIEPALPQPTHPADPAEFAKLMYRLRHDITDGHDLYHLYRNLGGMLDTHIRRTHILKEPHRTRRLQEPVPFSAIGLEEA